jgi:anti-sigma factor ChrR (cupin superfamily)
MQLNTDLAQRVIIDTSTLPWIETSMPGVSRRMLSRSGEESGKATSVVRYAPGTSFRGHDHPLGEEIFVLDGVFEDEFGAYPAGTYIKNPAGSRHSPFSTEGCLLFVKLDQLHKDDGERVVVRPNERVWQPGIVDGLGVVGLDSFETTHTALVSWRPGTRFHRHRHFGGEEIFVVSGVFEDEHQAYPAGTWIRSPHLSEHEPFSMHGCLILVKTGHLLSP